MCNEITSLPKVELHLHLEGAAQPKFIKNLANKKNVDLSKIFSSNGSFKFKNFDDFLTVYEIATSVIQTPDDFYNLTISVLEECVRSNVVYVEIFLSPYFCGGNDLIAWQEYLSAIREASYYCETAFGIVSRGIVTCIRHHGPEVARDTAKCAVATSDNWLVGFGMAGDESVGTPKDYAFSFKMAKDAGLKLTSHAGEWCCAESISATLTDLGVQRIGHGVQAINDDQLVKVLAREEIVLEICPGSNVFLGLFPNLFSHPIKRLRDKGVKVTVSTDDPPFFLTSMNVEYKSLAKTFGWTRTDFVDLNKVALGAAFCDDSTRKKIMQRL